MPYDSSLDQKIFAKAWESKSTRINVSVYSYNSGPKKIQITRENKDANENFRFTKLGRMAKDELEAVLPLLQQAITNM